MIIAFKMEICWISRNSDRQRSTTSVSPDTARGARHLGSDDWDRFLRPDLKSTGQFKCRSGKMGDLHVVLITFANSYKLR
jgi:hypothetical protein